MNERKMYTYIHTYTPVELVPQETAKLIRAATGAGHNNNNNNNNLYTYHYRVRILLLL